MTIVYIVKSTRTTDDTEFYKVPDPTEYLGLLSELKAAGKLISTEWYWDPNGEFMAYILKFVDQAAVDQWLNDPRRTVLLADMNAYNNEHLITSEVIINEE